MGLVRVRMWCGDDLLVTHRASSPICYFAPGTANLKSCVFVSAPVTVIEAVCVPSRSCQAVIS